MNEAMESAAGGFVDGLAGTGKYSNSRRSNRSR